MLFAILIGVIGTLNYVLKNWVVKLRFTLSSGKKVETNAEKLPFVIFSDDKRYWNVFEPICREFDRRGVDMVYMTASPDDPALENSYEHIKGEFIGKNNRAFARMNFLNAGIVLSTTPGLDVYQWKRSKDVQYYVHIPHMANDITGYRMFGVDYYDAVLLSGEYQVQEVRDLEKLRDLPQKDLYKVGIPYMDEMTERLKKAPAAESGGQKCTVLLAPSWGESSIFGKYGGRILEVLLQTGYHIIVRPHPQSFTSEKELMEKIMQEYPESDRMEWNRGNDNFEVLKCADILISDFSGIISEFAFVYNKPVIYADTEFDTTLCHGVGFLLFLYNSPAGLVLYWTLNNVFSLEKTVFYKLKELKKILNGLLSACGLLLEIYELFLCSPLTLKRTVLFTGCAVLLQLPLVSSLLKKTDHRGKIWKTENKKLFFAGGVFLCVLTGVLIQSSVIKASPLEFIDITYFYHPLWFIVSSLCLAFGIFVVWAGVFYFLAKPVVRIYFDRAVWILAGIFTIDYMFFGKDLGQLTRKLTYESELEFTKVNQLYNVLAVIAAALVFI